MSADPRVEAVLAATSAIGDARERAAYLDQACAGDASLRREVESLLAAHDDAGTFLQQPAPGAPLGVPPSGGAAPEPPEGGNSNLLAEKEGDRIGRYKLLEKIGTGGFGDVWMAEQEEPVRRRVALKVIKLGMDTREVIARFEAERQALALMDHPNIAKVFDGGATTGPLTPSLSPTGGEGARRAGEGAAFSLSPIGGEGRGEGAASSPLPSDGRGVRGEGAQFIPAGRPYFVMELVRGIRITDYCDANNLPTVERLKLFMQVCHAVQHAHQKGIIHRDLKPSNILVTVNDGVPVPKVIDFGIAKATEQRLTDKTVFTRFMQFLGTPAYMSPEQAELTSLDIDTRSDIYSLGVLLYELLTGKTPFDAKELLAAGLDEMRRTIREKEPVRPSTRLSTLQAADQTEVARRRKADPLKLINLLRGDLDWIVMKALEKDRTRRYETATSLVQDLQRHLNSEPVLARPPSALYRWQKFARKHRTAVTTAACVAALLVAATAVSTALALWANRERGRAERAQTSEAAQRRTAETERERAVAAEQGQSRLRQQAEANEKTARMEALKSEQVGTFLKKMLEGVGPSIARGRDSTMLREILDRTTEKIGQDLKDQPDVEAELRTTLGRVYHDLAEFNKAEANQRRALELRRQLLDRDHPLIGELLHDLAGTLNRQGNLAEAEELFRDLLDRLRKREGNEHPRVATTLNHLGVVLKGQGRLAEAEALQREALALRKKLGASEGAVAHSLHNLADVLREQEKLAEAETLFREALALLKKVKGQEDPDVALASDNLALLLRKQGKLGEAEALHREALTVREKLLGHEHRNVATSMNHLAKVLEGQGKLAEAEALQREALAMRRKLLGNDHLAVAKSLNDLARVLESQDKLDEAEVFQREALTLSKKLQGDAHPDVANQFNNLAGVLSRQGKLAEAEALYRETLAVRKKVLGDEHPGVAQSLKNLAYVLKRQRKLPEAEAVLREALQLAQKRFAQESDEVSDALSDLIVVLLQERKFTEAERLARECLAIREKLKPEGSLTFVARSMVGTSLLGQKRYAEAEPLLVQAFEGLKRRETEQPSLSRARLVSAAGQRVVELYEAWGKPAKAAEWRAKLNAPAKPAEDVQP